MLGVQSPLSQVSQVMVLNQLWDRRQISILILNEFTQMNQLLFPQTSSENGRRHGVVDITTAQLHGTKPELRLCAGSNPTRGLSEIRDGEDL